MRLLIRRRMSSLRLTDEELLSFVMKRRSILCLICIAYKYISEAECKSASTAMLRHILFLAS